MASTASWDDCPKFKACFLNSKDVRLEYKYFLFDYITHFFEIALYDNLKTLSRKINVDIGL